MNGSASQRKQHLCGKHPILALPVQKSMVFSHHLVHPQKAIAVISGILRGQIKLPGLPGPSDYGIDDINIELPLEYVYIYPKKALLFLYLHTGFHGIVQEISQNGT